MKFLEALTIWNASPRMTLDKARAAQCVLDKTLPDFRFGQNLNVPVAGLMAQEALAWAIRELERHGSGGNDA